MKSGLFLSMVGLSVALFAVGAAPTPTWPAANVTWWNSALTHITDMEVTIGEGMTALSDSDMEAIAPAAAAVAPHRAYFSETKAPAQLAPVAAAALYEADTCTTALNYFSTLTPANANNVLAMSMLLDMQNGCRDAIQATRMEVARAIAAVGAYPPTK